MKILITLLFTLISASTFATEQDWRIDYFDRLQTLYRQYEQKEVEVFTGIDSDLQGFYNIFLPLQESGRKISRYIFVKNLNEASEKVEMKNPYSWVSESSDEEERLAKVDPIFFEIYQEYLGHKSVYRGSPELIKKYNSVTTQHEESINQLYTELHEKMMLLQKEVDEKMANHLIKRTE